jgi:hypothetical protein
MQFTPSTVQLKLTIVTDYNVLIAGLDKVKVVLLAPSKQQVVRGIFSDGTFLSSHHYFASNSLCSKHLSEPGYSCFDFFRHSDCMGSGSFDEREKVT